MHDTCSSRAYHDGHKCKDSLALIFIRHRCLLFRLKTSGGCLGVVRVTSLVASCGGHKPPTNQCHQPAQTNVLIGRATRLTQLLAVFTLCLRYLEPAGPTGLHESTRWESTHDLDSNHVSSWYEIITEPSSVECGILLTYADHVGASLGRWSFRRGK